MSGPTADLTDLEIEDLAIIGASIRGTMALLKIEEVSNNATEMILECKTRSDKLIVQIEQRITELAEGGDNGS